MNRGQKNRRKATRGFQGNLIKLCHEAANSLNRCVGTLKSMRATEVLVYNVSHTDLVLGMHREEGEFDTSKYAASLKKLKLACPKFNRFAMISERILKSLQASRTSTLKTIVYPADAGECYLGLVLGNFWSFSTPKFVQVVQRTLFNWTLGRILSYALTSLCPINTAPHLL